MKRFALTLLSGLVATSASAATAVLTPAQDNTIYSFSSGISNGAGITFVAGRTGAGGYCRGLLRFNLGSIPAGSTVTSATLRVRVMRSNSGLQPFRVHRVVRSWGEAGSISHGGGGQGNLAQSGDATWEHTFFSSAFWDSPGGDFVALQSGGFTVDLGSVTTPSTPEMVDDVQSWVDAPVTNFGWIVIGVEGLSLSAKAFASRQETDTSLRPTLTVQYDASTPVARTTWGRIKAAYRDRGARTPR